MGIFSIFKKNKVESDVMAVADSSFAKGDYTSAIEFYQKVINDTFVDKEPKYYTHLTKKIIECHKIMGNYEILVELWPSQYSSGDYTPKEMYELIKILESAQRYDLMIKIYEKAGKPLLRNKIEFLIKQKKIPEAYNAMNELIARVEENHPEIEKIWMSKAKLSMSLLKFEESNKYLDKILAKNQRNDEARRLKDFCLKQAKN